jgi:serpin B
MTIRILFASILLAACTSTTAGPEPIAPPEGAEIVRSSRARLTAGSATPSEVAELAADDAAFAFDLYREVRDEEGNLFFSPHSISVALAMTYAGAEGTTEAQMASTLHYELPEPDLHRTMNALDQTLALRNREGTSLRILNAIWPERQYEFLPAYVDTLGESYGAGLYLLDYRTDAAGARLVINDWVSGQTAGRIPELIPEGILTDATRLVLTNAIHFEGSWQFPFDESKTTDGPFTTLEGGQVTVPLMQQTLAVPYAETADYQAVELPYIGDELALVAIVPTGDFRTFEAGLSAGVLAEARASLEERNVSVTLPRLSIGGRIDLKPELQSLGMVDAFSAQADFSGMDGSHLLYIEAVLHQANLDVDEIGTVASGATAVVINERVSLPAIRLDRPFVLAIVDRPTGTVLFLGRVVDPTA